MRSKIRKIIQNQLVKLMLPRAPMTLAVWLVVSLWVKAGVVFGVASAMPPWAILLDEGPNAVPSGEKKLFDGELVVNAGVVVTPEFLVPELPPGVTAEAIVPFTVPEIVPPLFEIIVEPPPLPPPFVFCTLVKLFEDSVPVTSEASAIEVEKNINISKTNDFNNI
jgi:hypothetical protein